MTGGYAARPTWMGGCHEQKYHPPEHQSIAKQESLASSPSKNSPFNLGTIKERIAGGNGFMRRPSDSPERQTAVYSHRGPCV
jgi:hypothetical protein